MLEKMSVYYSVRLISNSLYWIFHSLWYVLKLNLSLITDSLVARRGNDGKYLFLLMNGHLFAFHVSTSVTVPAVEWVKPSSRLLFFLSFQEYVKLGSPCNNLDMEDLLWAENVDCLPVAWVFHGRDLNQTLWECSDALVIISLLDL